MEISENANEWRVWVMKIFKIGILTTFKQKKTHSGKTSKVI